MPHLTPLSWAAWLLAIVFQPFLVALMRLNGLWRRWPSVFLFLIIKSVGSFALLAIYVGLRDPFRRAALYFYTYWSFSFMAALVQVWMIIQIGCEMAGVTRRVRRWIGGGTSCCAAVVLGVSLILALETHVHFPGVFTEVVLSLNKAVNLAWLTTFMVLVLAYEFLGIRGFDSVRGISIGFAIEAAGATAASWLIGVVRNTTAVSNLQDIIYLLALSAWAAALASSPNQNAVPDASGRFTHSLRSYVDAFQRITRTRI